MKIGYLPVADLLRHVGTRTSNIPTWNGGTQPVILSAIGSILDYLAVDRTSKDGKKWAQRIARAIRSGWIRIEHAEDLCDQVGIHPTAIWGHTYYDSTLDAEHEPDGKFCGRPEEWQAIGHTRHYGIYGTI